MGQGIAWASGTQGTVLRTHRRKQVRESRVIYSCLVPTQNISTILRFNIWRAHNRICSYCSEPLSFGETDIDHVIPETLRTDEKKYHETLLGLGLPIDFDIHSYANLLPAHRRCNRAKSHRTWNMLSFYTQIASAASQKIEDLMAATREQGSREKALRTLSDAIQSGLITPSDLIDSPLPPDVLVLARPLVFEDGTENFISPEQVERFLDRPVLIGGSEGFHVDFGDEKGIKLSIRTIREYRAALSAGYYARSQTDIKLEGYLKNINSVLTLVESVRVPTLSFIEKPFKGICDIDLIPVSVLSSLSPDDRTDLAAMKNLSLRDLLDRQEIKILNLSSKEVKLEWRNTGLLMRESLRADLNGDGIEDILCEFYVWSKGGTFGASWTGILSRLGSQEPFVIAAI